MNYKGIGESNEFEQYQRLTKELVRVQISEATREEKLAFFINVYNAQVIHANVTMGPPVNLWQRYKVRLSLVCYYHHQNILKCIYMYNFPVQYAKK